MSRKLFVLRAYWTETWNDADDGLVEVCEVYKDISFSSASRPLQDIAENLARSHGDGFWTEKRAKELRALWSNYDEFEDYTFKVEDITGLFLVS